MVRRPPGSTLFPCRALLRSSRNPRYPHVSASGSSTGSAVSVAAGFCDVSVGSDSGGSLRWPAVYCGATALRLTRSEEHTSELQSRQYLVCRLLLEKRKRRPQ